MSLQGHQWKYLLFQITQSTFQVGIFTYEPCFIKTLVQRQCRLHFKLPAIDFRQFATFIQNGQLLIEQGCKFGMPGRDDAQNIAGIIAGKLLVLRK